MVGLNEYTAGWSTENHRSHNHSLKIEIESIEDGGSFAYWWQLIESDIPYNKSLVLKAHIKLENVTALGVKIAIRTDGTNGVLGFADLKSPVKGNKNWTSYFVCLPPADMRTKRIFIFLICYPKTTGVIFVDDISLTSYDL